jgi:hypothetical protein
MIGRFHPPVPRTLSLYAISAAAKIQSTATALYSGVAALGSRAPTPRISAGPVQ